MGESQRRLVLYVTAAVVAGSLLFAGFGITIPPDADTRLNGAAMLAEVGDIDGALDICDTVIAEHPDNGEAHVYRAAFLGRAKRYDEAFAAYDKALERIEEGELKSNVRLDHAGLLLEAGRTAEFEKARADLARNGDRYRVLILDGFAAAKRKDWAAAAAAFEKALGEKPDDDGVKSRLWNARMQTGKQALSKRRFDDALRAFDACAELFPTATEAHMKGAEVQLALGEPHAAIERLRSLPPQTPGIAALVFRGATALLERGDTESALDALAGAFVADPEGTRTLFDKETAWDSRRNDAAVVAILESIQAGSPARLTAKG